ncbi:hypothetical protein FD44_GL000177 [Secundilactobacillus malefermentans DSM 5705 = KCTC 3548]|nr:hypothetical protein FD44_GL000177 [Secundilactobacillus malefermentans DSM 5705 = KCTC 3548]
MVRHGQTYLNKYHRIQGWADTPLTDNGVKDAKRAGERLQNVVFDRAISSDARRAKQTAQYILAENNGKLEEPEIDIAFREENFGYFEGNDDYATWHMVGSPHGTNNFHEMIDTFSIEKTKDMLHDADPYHDAEDNATFWGRLQPGFDRIIKDAKDGDKVFISTHGTLIRSVVSKFSDINVAVSAINGSVTKLKVEDGKISVVYFNNVDQPID